MTKLVEYLDEYVHSMSHLRERNRMKTLKSVGVIPRGTLRFSVLGRQLQSNI